MAIIFDENGNLILENTQSYIVGDVIVIDNKDEYEITFVDVENNIAYAEFNGSYNNNNFTSKYYKNIILFSVVFISFLLFVFFLALFYKLKLQRKRNNEQKRH